MQINKGQRIRQFLLLPHQAGKNLTFQAKSHRAFRSSDLAFWVQEITAPRPLKDLLIQGNKMSGLSYASPVFLPGKPYGQRNLVDYSPQGHKELDATEHALT